MLIGIMLVHCMNCMSSTTTERTTDRKQLDQESQEQRHHQGATYYLHERKNEKHDLEWLFHSSLC